MRTSETDKISVLVVDDQSGVRRLLQEALQEEGFDVRLADCGEAALRQVQERKPDLILMDMKMPGMSGLDVLKELKTGVMQLVEINRK
ncbi:MAG: response regulator [Bacillota bacterium]